MTFSCAGAVYGPALDAALAKCRQEAREAYNGGMTYRGSIDVYERCKLREGAF
jgi:hypothetical protein